MIQKLIEFFSKNQKYFTIGGACILLVLNGQQRTRIISLQDELNKIKTTNITAIENDSLQTELFILQTQNNRYEMAMNYLYEIDSTSAIQFEEYLNNETE
jgi:predicted P-loop ATPase